MPGTLHPRCITYRCHDSFLLLGANMDGVAQVTKGHVISILILMGERYVIPPYLWHNRIAISGLLLHHHTPVVHDTSYMVPARATPFLPDWCGCGTPQQSGRPRCLAKANKRRGAWVRLLWDGRGCLSLSALCCDKPAGHPKPADQPTMTGTIGREDAFRPSTSALIKLRENIIPHQEVWMVPFWVNVVVSSLTRRREGTKLNVAMSSGSTNQSPAVPVNQKPGKAAACVSDACAPPRLVLKPQTTFSPRQRTKFNSSAGQTISALPSYTRPCELSETGF
ncbi:hypothetical protein BJ166DRAFT_375936 [Pestalotiopsis sp. NC0098]|nr:hypothetical protein BJ166DRAFT_375936 [Pestalotiopsis sp. NC0098]